MKEQSRLIRGRQAGSGRHACAHTRALWLLVVHEKIPPGGGGSGVPQPMRSIRSSKFHATRKNIHTYIGDDPMCMYFGAAHNMYFCFCSNALVAYCLFHSILSFQIQISLFPQAQPISNKAKSIRAFSALHRTVLKQLFSIEFHGENNSTMAPGGKARGEAVRGSRRGWASPPSRRPGSWKRGRRCWRR